MPETDDELEAAAWSEFVTELEEYLTDWEQSLREHLASIEEIPEDSG